MEYKVKYQTRRLLDFHSKWMDGETILVTDEKDMEEVGCECLMLNKFGISRVYHILECIDANGKVIEKDDERY